MLRPGRPKCAAAIVESIASGLATTTAVT
jgi:hypothetical protein